MASVLISALPCNRSLSAKNWNKLSSQLKYNRQSLINSAQLFQFHVTWATWIMLATLPDIFTNACLHTRTQRLANNFWRPMGAYVI